MCWESGGVRFLSQEQRKRAADRFISSDRWFAPLDYHWCPPVPERIMRRAQTIACVLSGGHYGPVVEEDGEPYCELCSQTIRPSARRKASP